MQAVRRLRDAAARGDAIAQEQLGTMYYYGVAVEEDYKKAAEWYRGAANQGSAKAQTNLGALMKDFCTSEPTPHVYARFRGSDSVSEETGVLQRVCGGYHGHLGRARHEKPVGFADQLPRFEVDGGAWEPSFTTTTSNLGYSSINRDLMLCSTVAASLNAGANTDTPGVNGDWMIWRQRSWPVCLRYFRMVKYENINKKRYEALMKPKYTNVKMLMPKIRSVTAAAPSRSPVYPGGQVR